MLTIDGDADAAVETRNRIGWNKFRQLLTNKNISLIVRGDCTAVVCKVVHCMAHKKGK